MAGHGTTPLPGATGRRASRGSSKTRGSRASRGSSQRHRGSGQSIGAHARIAAEDDILQPNNTLLRIAEEDDILQPNNTLPNETDEDPEDVQSPDVEDDVEDVHFRSRGESQPHTRIALDVHGNDLFCPDTEKWLVPKLATQLTSAIKDRTHSDPCFTAASAEKMKNKYGIEDVTAWPYNVDEVYVDSMGKPKKGRYYGLEANTTLVTLSSEVGSSSHVTPTYDTPTSEDEIQSMRRDLNNLKEKFKAMLEERDERDDRMVRMIVQAIDRRLSEGATTTPP